MKTDSSTLNILRLILIGLSAVLLICAIKNYLIFITSGTPWCRFLCPSTFEWGIDGEAYFFGYLFFAQKWLTSNLQELAFYYLNDHWGITNYLLIAPLLEELIYRGPLFLTVNYAKRAWWWFAGIVLALLFALSHGKIGLSLLPLIVLGLYSLWLIAETRRLWPSIVLHFLYNFFFFSVLLYQSLWATD